MGATKKNTALAMTLFILCIVIFTAISIVAMLLIKDMLMFLLFGTFASPVLITLLFVFIDRMGNKLKVSGAHAMIGMYVSHALCLGVISPVLTAMLGWQLEGFEGYGVAEVIAANIIISIICGGIVFAIQVAIINYCCDNWFFTSDYYRTTYSAPQTYSGSASYDTDTSDSSDYTNTASSSDDVPKYYGVSNEDGDSLGFVTKKAHEELDDLSGSFYGTNT